MKAPAHTNYFEMELDELAEVMLSTNHPELKKASVSLEREITIAGKVDSSIHPEVNLMKKVFTELKEKLEQHNNKEAHLLLPIIKKLGEEKRKGNYNSEADVIMAEEKMSELRAEHTKLKQKLAQVRMLCLTHPLSVNSSPSLKNFYAEFSDFEQALLKEFFIEDEILAVKFRRYAEFIIDINLKGVVF